MAQTLFDYSIVVTAVYYALFGAFTELAPPRLKHQLWIPGLAIAIFLAVASTLSMFQPVDEFAATFGFLVFVTLTIAGLATNICSSCGKIGPGFALHVHCQACNDKEQTS